MHFRELRLSCLKCIPNESSEVQGLVPCCLSLISLSLSLSLSLSRSLFLSLSLPACPFEDSGGLVGLLVSHHVLAVLEEVVCRHLLVLVAREIRLKRDLSNIKRSEKALAGSEKDLTGNEGVREGEKGSEKGIEGNSGVKEGMSRNESYLAAISSFLSHARYASSAICRT